MVFEDFDNPAPKALDTNVNAQLFACAYPTDNERPRATEAKDSKEPKETPEQRTDNKIKDTFGADLLSHLKDHDWLIDHRKTLEDGFKKANARDAWEMAQRMRELSKVDGKSLIYISKSEGQTSGSLLQKRYDIYLRRGSLRSDNYLGHVYH